MKKMMNPRYFAGIGARNTPKDILDKFFKIGAYLAKKGFVLRSGGADGADATFEEGCVSENGAKEIYLPWKGFNNNNSELYNIPIGARLIASQRYSRWDEVSIGVQKLMSRNVEQILGLDLNTPVEFVVCWTEDGKDVGGTSFAVLLARELNIPVFNYGSDGQEKLREYITK